MAQEILNLNVITKYTAKSDQYNREIDKAVKKTKGFSTTLKNVATTAAGFLTAEAILGLVRSLRGLATEFVNLADTQLKAEQQLLTALKGRRDIQENIINLAGELQGVSLFGDEATIEAGAKLASILGDNEEAITQLLPLVQDFATNQKIDLTTAADLVGKSVGTSTNALVRYGIEIEGAVGSAERLESAINSLNRQVGGQALAAFNAGAGPLQEYQNLVSDLKEAIGIRLLPVINQFARRGSDLVKTLTELVAVPVAEELENERIELNLLVDELTNVNTGEERRSQIIQTLSVQYPELIKNIDLETASNEELRKELTRVNEQFIARIALAEVQADLDRANRKLTREARREANAERELRRELIRVEEEFGIEGVRQNEEFVETLSRVNNALRERAEFSTSARTGVTTATNAEAEALQRLSRAGADRFVSQQRAAPIQERVNELQAEYNQLLEEFSGILESEDDDIIIPRPDGEELAADLGILDRYVEGVIESYNRLINFALQARRDQAVDLIDTEGPGARFVERIKKEAEAVKEAGVDNPFVNALLLAVNGEEPELEITLPTIRTADGDGGIFGGFPQEDLDQLISSLDLAQSALNSFYDNQIARIDQVISKQQERVDQFKELAEKGNAEQLQLEEERLEKLQRARETAARRQQTLQTAQLAASQAVAAGNAIASIFQAGNPLIGVAQALVAVGAITSIVSAIQGQFASLQSFAEGSEFLDLGRATGPTDGYIIEAHRGERIVQADINARMGSISNEELPFAVAAYRDAVQENVKVTNYGPATVDQLRKNEAAIRALAKEMKRSRSEINIYPGSLEAKGRNIDIREIKRKRLIR